MIKRVLTLLGAYFLTISSMAKAEASADMRAIEAMVARKIVGAVVALLGLVWLNVALVLFLLTTPWPLEASLAIGVLAALVGIVLLRSGGKSRTAPLSRTREVLRDEFAAMGIVGPTPAASPGTPDLQDLQSSAGLPHAAPAGTTAAAATAPDPLLAPLPDLSPEGASARLREIRIEIGNEISPRQSPYLPRGVPPLPSRPDFVPRSKTMRTILSLYRTGQSGTGRKLAGGVLSLLALRSPGLRRAMAGAAMVRTISRGVGSRLKRA